LIVRWPGKIEPGSEDKTPVTSVDYLPTVCEAVSVPLPVDRSIDGLSLLPLLIQKGKLDREDLFWHFPHYRGEIMPYSIIRSQDWKLIKRYEGQMYELFNLREDLSEESDLSKKHPKKVAELNQKLEAWLKDTGAKMPKPNPNYNQQS
jgi:arylsulfatase A-like enzyme